MSEKRSENPFSASDGDDFDGPDDGVSGADTGPAAARSTVDPVSVAVGLMIDRAVSKRGLRRRLSGRGKAIVVQAPGPDWVAPLALRWKSQFFGGTTTGSGEFGTTLRRGTSCIIFDRSGRDSKHSPKNGNDAVAAALWQGIAVLGIAPSPDIHLPEDLVRSADVRLAIPAFDEAMLRSLVSHVTGRVPKGPIPADVPGRITPDILRLGRRPRQPAEAYLASLVALAAAPPAVGRPGPLLEEIAGMDEAVEWGKRWVRDLEDYRNGLIGWRDLGVGLLLHGAPGAGKTMFVESLARSAGLELIPTSFSEWQSSKTGHLGECLAAMRACFARAKRVAPCILFVDEMDAIGDRATCNREHRDYWTAVVTCFLEMLDGVGGREGVLVVGATNNPHVIDPAILRSGRMDKLIEIPRPTDCRAVERILRCHLRDDLADASLSVAARRAVGSSGADCARWVRLARQTARQEGRPMVLADLLDAIGGVALPEDIEWRIAAHEAGHAVAAAVLRPGELLGARIGGGYGATGGSVSVLREVRTTREAVHIRCRYVQMIEAQDRDLGEQVDRLDGEVFIPGQLLRQFRRGLFNPIHFA